MTGFMQRACIAASLGLVVAGTAVAQAQQSGGPNSCANSGGSSGELSDKLSRSKGVICPPDVDPGMQAPTPETGKMPVIQPPGSPGGNQNMQPK